MDTECHEILEIENYIGGKYIKTDKFIDSYDPATGEIWAKIPDSDEKDVDLAVDAAKNAFETWSKTTVEQRSKILLKISELLESKLDEFAKIESRDQGKTIQLAKTVDIPRAVYNFKFFGTAILHYVNTSTFQDKFNALNYTTRHPIGVAGLISPWNLPMYLLTFKIAPAIACGNTVVCKPSEMTSVTAWMLCKVMDEAGLPPGVVNMVFGTGQKAGDALVKHPDVKLLSFTGSTATAEKIRQAAAPFCKKLSLELGGKNAGIIFDDADLEKCLPTVLRSSFTNQGEVCLCTSRVFVQKGIYEEFVNKFVEKAKTMIVGNPSDKDTKMGALISQEHMAKVKGYIDIAVNEGATINTGLENNRFSLPEEFSKGYFIPPTVITNVSDSSPVMKEEIFGPVVCIVPFTTEQEVVQRANDVSYGLCACVWSRDVNKIHRVAKHLDVGTVWANCWVVRDLHMPFGGTKESGIGREGFHDSLDFFTEVKTVCVHIDPL